MGADDKTEIKVQLTPSLKLWPPVWNGAVTTFGKGSFLYDCFLWWFSYLLKEAFIFYYASNLYSLLNFLKNQIFSCSFLIKFHIAHPFIHWDLLFPFLDVFPLL